MFAFKQLFDFRSRTGARRGAWHDEEKPFLDHLEDLRRTLFKILATLAIAVIGCFFFHQQLFDILLQPLKLAQLDRDDLPVEVDSTRWNRAKLWAETYATLPDEAMREAYLAEIEARDEPLVEKAESRPSLHRTEQVPLARLLRVAWAYRAADSLQTEARDEERGPVPVEFFAAVLDPGEAEMAAELWERGADPQVSPLATALQMQALGPPEAFMMSIKVSLYSAVVFSFPLLLFFLAEFILPGLTPRERRALYPALGVGFGLFVAGILFAFFVVVPRALGFFHNWGSDLGLSEQWRIGYYISFVTQLTLIFGVCFELPVVVLTLIKLGLVTVQTLRSKRLWAYGLIMFAGAVITPTPDAFTLSLLAVPMLVLYELTILVGAAQERREQRQDEEEERRYREQVLRPALQVEPGDDDDGKTGNTPGPSSGPDRGEPEIRSRRDISGASSRYPSPADELADGPATDEDSPGPAEGRKEDD